MITKGKKDMAWNYHRPVFDDVKRFLFLSCLRKISTAVTRALEKEGIDRKEIAHWCSTPRRQENT
jgi:hypothetical protein